MATVKKLLRPGEWNQTTQVVQECNYLWLLVDLYDDGSCEEVVTLRFADHEGLEAEWVAGEATAVLEAALLSKLVDAIGDELTDDQRGVVNQPIIDNP